MLQKSAKTFVDNIEKKLYLSINEKTESVSLKLDKILQAFSYIDRSNILYSLIIFP